MFALINRLAMAATTSATPSLDSRDCITFINWCNHHLKGTGYKVNDSLPYIDFSDGVTFLKLLEVIAHENISKMEKLVQ